MSVVIHFVDKALALFLVGLAVIADAVFFHGVAVFVLACAQLGNDPLTYFCLIGACTRCLHFLHDFGGNLFSEDFVFALRRSRRVNGDTGQQDCGEDVFQDFIS